MLDLEHFKDINDASDSLARLGSDEFGVLLPATEAQDSPIVAGKLRRTIEQARLGPSPDHNTGRAAQAGRLRPGTVFVGATGAATPTADAPPADMQTLLRAADAALYDAKAVGRNRVVVDRTGESELHRAA
jgi:two-component system cell cycle response regulator